MDKEIYQKKQERIQEEMMNILDLKEMEKIKGKMKTLGQENQYHQDQIQIHQSQYHQDQIQIHQSQHRQHLQHLQMVLYL